MASSYRVPLTICARLFATIVLAWVIGQPAYAQYTTGVVTSVATEERAYTATEVDQNRIFNPWTVEHHCGDDVCTAGERGCSRDCTTNIHPYDYFYRNQHFEPGEAAAHTLAPTQKMIAPVLVPTDGAPLARNRGIGVGSGLADADRRARAQPESAAPQAVQHGEITGQAPVPEDDNDWLPTEQGDNYPRGPEAELPATTDNEAREASDPVDPISGEMVVKEVDIHLPGVGLPFLFKRVYRSRWSYRGVLGWGWSHNFEQRLIFEDNPCGAPKVVWLTGDGGQVRYLPNEGRYVAETPSQYILSHPSADLWVVTQPSGQETHFDGQGLLTEMVDLNGNRLTVEHQLPFGVAVRRPPQVSRVVDTVGREILFFYDARGFLREVAVDGTDVSVLYEIDINEDLAVVQGAGRNSGGGGVRYDYLSGWTNTLPFVPTPLLDATCEAQCKSSTTHCGLSACGVEARNRRSACMDRCFQPEACVQSCGQCTSDCAAVPEVAACVSGPNGCLSQCLPHCNAEVTEYCQDMSGLYTTGPDSHSYRVECEKQCAPLARAICDETLWCERSDADADLLAASAMAASRWVSGAQAPS